MENTGHPSLAASAGRRLVKAAVIGVLVMLLVAPIQSGWAAHLQALAIGDVRITDVRDVSLVVSWTTDQPAGGSVEYGSTAALGLSQADPVGAATTHYVILSALTPETTYYLRVRSGDAIDDNGGALYQVATGTTLSSSPTGRFIYGYVFQADGTTPAPNAIVYLRIQDRDGTPTTGFSQWASARTDASGGWFYSDLGNIRTSDAGAFFAFTLGADDLRFETEAGALGAVGSDPNPLIASAPLTYPAQIINIVLRMSLMTVTRGGAGGGTVTSEPAGIDCGPTCTAPFEQGAAVTLAPKAREGSRFAGWDGTCTGALWCTVTMDGPKEVRAIFEPVVQRLTVGKAGTGSGAVTSAPGGIDCGSVCEAAYGQGTVVGLTATADEGSAFMGWLGDCTGKRACTVTMNRMRSVRAVFEQRAYELTVGKTGRGSGVVASEPAGISCGSRCRGTYGAGTVVTLSATAAANSRFVGWSGACTGTGACTVTMDGARRVFALFVRR